jgi:hypothetical protein
MKIAIHSLPRCGTKTLQINFNNYLKETGSRVICADHPYGVGEPFNLTEEEFHSGFTSNILKEYTDYGPVFIQGAATPLYRELAHRFGKLMKRPNRSWVFKRNNLTSCDPLLFDTITRVDKCIAVIRQDTFDHCLSFCLAKHLQIWTNGTELENAIETFSKNKIKLDVIDFLNHYKEFVKYKNIPWTNHFQIVNFYDLVQIKTGEEFCKFFNLNYYPFDFKKFEIEYGDNKFSMIENVNELRELCKDIA